MQYYSAILLLKIVNNKSIEAIKLSKIPRDIWTRVALSEIIPCTDFRRGDVVQRSPISRSYLGYWAYRIYMGEWSDRYGYIYIYIFLRRGRRLPVKAYFFSFLYARLKNGCIMLWQCPSVCPSLRVFRTFFNILWDINLKLGICIQ